MGSGVWEVGSEVWEAGSGECGKYGECGKWGAVSVGSGVWCV